MKEVTPRWSVFTTACVYTVIIRLLPYALRALGVEIDPTVMTWPWNFSPAIALCLYGGGTLPSRGLSLLAPLGVYLTTDLGIWALTGRLDWAFYPAQAAVYGALVLCAMVGWSLQTNRNWYAIAGCAFLTPWLFFLITNGACWVGNPLYQQNPAGLMECYAAGLLHQRNLLVSTMLFSGILFSPLGVRSALRSEATQPVPAV